MEVRQEATVTMVHPPVEVMGGPALPVMEVMEGPQLLEPMGGRLLEVMVGLLVEVTTLEAMGEPLEGDKEEMRGATCIREDSKLCLSNFKFWFIVVNNTKHIHVHLLQCS